MSETSTRAAGLRISLLYATFFGGIGFFMPYFPLWLLGRGLSEREIGMVLAVGPLTRVFAAPLAAQLADRVRDVGLVLALTSMGMVAGVVALGLAPSFGWLLLAMVFCAMFWGPTGALTEAFTAGVIHRRPSLQYGRMRLWGSISFMVASIGGGFIVDRIAPANIIWAQLLFIAPAAAAAILLLRWMRAETAPRAVPDAMSEQPGSQRTATLALAILGYTVIQASHMMVMNFGSIHWQKLGFSGGFLGAAWSVGVVLEIGLLFAASNFVSTAKSAFLILAMSGAVAAFRWLVLAHDVPGWVILIVQASHGFTYGLAHVSTMFLLARFGNPSGRARLQGWMASSIAATSAAASWLSGVLYANYGQTGFLGMIPIAIAGAVLILIAYLSARGSNGGQPQTSGGGGTTTLPS